MDYIGKLVEKLRGLAQRLIETILGPESNPEPELIPIPVKEPNLRRRK